MDWSRNSWRKCRIGHDPYKSVHGVENVEERLQTLPPIVQPAEILQLRSLLAQVHRQKKFILQGGDCAERFLDCSQEMLTTKLKIFLQMSLIISWGSKMPTVRIGRIAGQYAKPRSNEFEMVDGREVHTYKGDCINCIDPTKRTPNPERLLDAYFHSTATLNFLRSSLACGFADLHLSKHWQLDYVLSAEHRARYEEIVAHLLKALSFMDACGCSDTSSVYTADIFTSHEALVLPYESSLTRLHDDQKWYDTSAHFVWVGDRTRDLSGAHIEFCRGVENPIGIKVGPSANPSEIVEIIKKINPQNLEGKLVIITRFGESKVEERLPLLLNAVQAANLKVIWQCDPMHGNTRNVLNSARGNSEKIKTRDFDDILSELKQTHLILTSLGSFLGGVHFELTGEDVTECLGGPQALQEHHLSDKYTTYCDPRLNYAQSMEMALLLSELLRDTKEGASSIGVLCERRVKRRVSS